MGVPAMSEVKPFASLTPKLLARKGGAKPAMRSQLQTIGLTADMVETPLHEDLGWNDMGHELHAGAEVVQLQPEIVRQQRALAKRIAQQPIDRRSALADGRRAAFTLRVDADRHLKLRLACTVDGRSAQQLVTEALDRLLDEMPEVSELATRLSRRKHKHN